MKKIVEKRNYIILGIIIVLVILLFWLNLNKDKLFIKSFNFFDEVITLEFYGKRDALSDVSDILKKYQGYYDGDFDKGSLKMIAYGKDIYDDGFKNILADNININEVSTYKNMNLKYIAGPFSAYMISSYFKDNNISNYLINENGNVIAGRDKNYSVSISDNEGNVLGIVYLKDKCMVTKYINDRLIVVIADDILKANKMGYILSNMSISSSFEYLKDTNVYVLFKENGEVFMSDGFENFMKKSYLK